jgi:SAM-dependent methyltransferase
MTHDYYARVAAAFDRAAGSYQGDYAANPIMAWLEEDTFEQLCRLFPPGSRLLEIGCGTGEMALRLAGAGREVVATDISPAMIAQAQAAAAGHPARSRVNWLVAPAGALGAAEGFSSLSPRAGFDGAYSNFGPLNCEPDLAGFARALAAHLPSGAAFLCSVMNRWCAWEIAWGLARLRPREAVRRLGRGWRPARMSAGPGEAASTIPVRYFSPAEFSRTLSPAFRLERCLGYPTFIPPPYLAGRWPGAPGRLEGLERRARGWPGLRSLGDHFLLVLRRAA